MELVHTYLKEEITIKKIITIFYFEFDKNYRFRGERHDFWELIYVDKGEINIRAEDEVLKLRQGEIIFHKPNEFHSHWANGNNAINIFVMTFVCNSKAMRYFEGKILKLNDFESDLLAKVIKEAKNAFLSPLDKYVANELVRRKNSKFGCEQLIKINLELLLINLIRSDSKESSSKIHTIFKNTYENSTVNNIITLLQDRVYDDLSFDEICKDTTLSATKIKNLFKNITGTSVMEYYRLLKIEEAKKLIREGNYNFTEISEKLNYTSIHYFSKYFKQIVGMTPSEYATSIKAKSI